MLRGGALRCARTVAQRSPRSTRAAESGERPCSLRNLVRGQPETDEGEGEQTEYRAPERAGKQGISRTPEHAGIADVIRAIKHRAEEKAHEACAQ